MFDTSLYFGIYNTDNLNMIIIIKNVIWSVIDIDGEIPKTSNSTFGNCSGEGKNCPILLIHY